MRVLYVRIIKYTLIFIIVSYLSFFLLGYQATNDLALLIGYAIGYFGPIYLLIKFLFFKKRIWQCPQCGKRTMKIKKEFSKKSSSESLTKKIIDITINRSFVEMDKFDIFKEKLSICQNCDEIFILKSKLYAISIIKPENYSVKI